jgi:hypothetical protein
MAVERVARTIFDEHTEKLRRTYRGRRDAMLAALEEQMPEGVSWTRPEGGMFIWVTLPEGMDATALLAQALKEQRVAFVPGQAFYADRSNANTLRLSFSLASDSQIAAGITRLGEAIRAVQAD